MQGLAGAQAISGAAQPSMQLAQADLAGARDAMAQPVR